MVDRKNNLDIIRLFAASQVAILHLNGHLKINSPGIFWDTFLECIRPFPGVPIFFAISGFLIFASYDNNQSNKKYFINRFLRIYPLIYVITFITTVLLIVFAPPLLPVKALIVWFAGQVSLFQYYTPEALRYFGVGTPNGALWTIPVEIEFYLLVPVIYKLYKRFGNTILICIALVSFACYSFIPGSATPIVIKKLFETSIFYYLLHFSTGIFLYLYFDRIKKMIAGKGLFWLGGYLLFFFVFDKWLGLYHDLYKPNLLGSIAIALLALTVFSLAYTKPSLTHKIFKGNDYSYGVYVLHMVVANVMVEFALTQRFAFLIIALTIIFLMAFLSWKYIERPALALKKRNK
jgi:peptidoglycan/LPS O-acetylase OafA/YrhL